MKLLLENWRSYLNESRIHRRLVVNEVVDHTSEELREFPLSDEELKNIKEWGNLSGEPSFLGSGTMGSAYLFDNNKVLKVTSDTAEAIAAKLIEDKEHPNVYKILKVARRWGRHDDPAKEEPRRPYVIVYEMVGKPGLFNLPNTVQQEVVKAAHRGVSTETPWRNWPDGFERIQENFLESAMSYDLESNPTARFQSEEEKLDEILDSMQGDQKDKDAMKLAFGLTAGFYGANLNSAEKLKDKLNHQKRKFAYINDLASGLTFLKNNGVFFEDLKTTNVMSVNDRLIIIDIGKSRVKGSPELGTVGGTQ
jgi:serine/threonine protein kinase